MKKLLLPLVILLALIFTFSAFGQTSGGEQIVAENKAVQLKAKEILSGIVRAKNQNGGFVLVTPEDVAKLSDEDRDVVNRGISGAQAACDTALLINVGQTVNGQLTSADCRLEDGSYADFYAFDGTQGQQITVAMNSNAFDTYLGLASKDGTFTVEDDDGGGGTHSKIITTLPATGSYIILANSVFPNTFGDYTLSLTNTFTACSYTLEPTSAQISPTGGTFTFTVNTQPNCAWRAETNNTFFIMTNSSGTGTGTVSYTVTTNDSGSTRTGTITVAGRMTFTVTQTSLACTFALTPSSAAVGATESTNTFTVSAPAGCSWTASSPDFFITTYSTGTGNGTVTYTVRTNNAANRTGTIVVRGQTFTVTQPGLNCTYSVSPTGIAVDRFEHFGTINVTTQPGCTWDASAGYTFVELSNQFGTGSGAFTYRIYPNNTFGTRTWVIAFYGNDLTRIPVSQTGVAFKTRYDFDGDGSADVSVFRPENGVWYQMNSNTGFTATQFGIASDVPAAADFDGDRRADIAVFRNDGTWFLQQSTAGFTAVGFGSPGDIPVPADYTGDGKAEIAVYRPSNGVWYILNLVNNAFSAVQFGTGDDKPVVADYDGDGKADYAVYRPSSGVWYMLQSRDGFASVQFGNSTDKPVVGDYDGDGKADQAVYRPSNGVWYLNRSLFGITSVQFGIPTDIPAPADFDGDSKTDIAVFRPENGVWYQQRSGKGFYSIQFGANGDRPVSSAFVR